MESAAIKKTITNIATLTLAACVLFLCSSTLGAEEADHQRVFNLQGTKNTRDIGGYQTLSGRQVRWGKIFRSDNLSRLSQDDFQRLEAIGLQTVIDLRAPKEAERAPTIWQGDRPPQFFHYPIGRDDGEWFMDQERLLHSGSFTSKQTLEHYVNGYRGTPKAGLESYRKLLALVRDESNWPLLFHCSAGKDRSGIATALILEILGVGRDTIMEDYLLTNKVAKTHEQAALFAKQQAAQKPETGSRLRTRRSPSADAYFPLIGVTPEMLNGFYESVEKDYGSMDAYLTRLGFEPSDREALTDILTE